MPNTCILLDDGPFMVPIASSHFRAISAGPHACTNGLDPGTSAVAPAFSGRSCISLTGSSFTTRGRCSGKAADLSRLSVAGFRTQVRLNYGALDELTLPSTTATCCFAGPKRAVPS